jgi:hypothetical protein
MFSSDASRDDTALLPPSSRLEAPAHLYQRVPPGIDVYIQWFGVREPHNADRIELAVATPNHEDTLSTLEKMSKVRIKHHSLPTGLVDRMKGGVKS